jgi:hypothetical protein
LQGIVHAKMRLRGKGSIWGPGLRVLATARGRINRSRGAFPVGDDLTDFNGTTMLTAKL